MLPSVVATSAFVGGILVPEAEATVRSFRFATDDLPEPQREIALRGLRERGLLPLEPLPGRVAHVDITKQFLPGIGVLCGTLAGLSQEASPQQQDSGDELFFAVNLFGRSAALQRQREISFKDGEAVLFSGANGGFSVVRPTLVRLVGLRMSQKRLAPFARGQDDSSMRVIPANVAPLGLLASYVGAIANGVNVDRDVRRYRRASARLGRLKPRPDTRCCRCRSGQPARGAITGDQKRCRCPLAGRSRFDRGRHRGASSGDAALRPQAIRA